MNAVIDFDKLREKAVEKGFHEFHEGNFHDAEEIFEQYQDDDNARIGMSMVLFNAGKPDEALAVIDGIDSLDAWGARCTLYKALNNADKEIEALAKYHDLSEGQNWKVYAEVLLERKRYADAEPILLKAKTEYSHVLLADCYIHAGELDKARTLLKAVLSANKNSVAALLELCGIATDKSELTNNVTPELHRIMIANATHVDTKAALLNALAKAYELHGDMSAACVEYTKFFAVEYAKINPKVFESRLPVEKIAETYTPEFIGRVPKAKDRCPLIFIMGMPRSGTTLIEQTLVAHSQIDSLGETTGISEVIDDIQRKDVELNSPDEALAYYKKKFDLKDTDGYIIDKMPGNFHFIGMIYQLFPDAKFIYSHRNPLDNCVGCMTTHFNQGHPYSKSPEQMALEYANHVKVIDFWKALLPEGSILDLSYEDNVDDHAKQTSRLMAFLGIDNEPACEKFYELKRDVRTASLAQVAKPIYTTSMGRGQRLVDADVEDGVFKLLNEKLTEALDGLY